jgi:hypothetical protein
MLTVLLWIVGIGICVNAAIGAVWFIAWLLSPHSGGASPR